MGWYRAIVKPAFDYGLAILIILFLWPVFLLIYIINFLVFGSGLFIQERIGRGEEIFECLKYRSLKHDGDDLSAPFWGKFLRYSSLDELPQVINILRGEMSFIGPRPLLPEYLEEYSPEQRKRHNVKPGITGLAQIRGRNLLKWEESLTLDVHYAEHISFRLDFQIFIRTIPQLFRFNEVQQSKSITREPFKRKAEQ